MKKRYIVLIVLGAFVTVALFFGFQYIVTKIYNYRVDKSTEVWITGDTAVSDVFNACSTDNDDKSVVYYYKDDKYVLFEDKGTTVTSRHNYGETDADLTITYDQLVDNANAYFRNEHFMTFHEFTKFELMKEDFHRPFNFEDCRLLHVSLYEDGRNEEQVSVYKNIYAVISDDGESVMLIVDQTEVSGEYYLIAKGEMIDVVKQYVNKQHRDIFAPTISKIIYDNQ